MERYDVYVTKTADFEMFKAVDYIANELHSPIAAEELMTRFERAIAGLSEMPEIHSPVLQADGYRKILVKKYIMFFTVDGLNKTVNVERVLHSSQNWIDILNQRSELHV